MKKQNGITLIALVITIIVLLILAGVTIAAITSNESAPNKAVEAREANEIGAAKDAATLLVADKIQGYYEEKYVNMSTTAGNILTYLKGQPNKNGLGGAGATTGEYTVVITDGEDASTGTITVTKGAKTMATGVVNTDGIITWNATQTGDNGNQQQGGNNNSGEGEGQGTGNNTATTRTVTVNSFASLNTDAQLPSDKNTIVQKGTGDTQQQIVIPAGFIIASDSGTTIEEGIVIEDATEGNQFVWIPVNQVVTYSDMYNNSALKTNIGETATSGRIILGRYSFGTVDEPTIERAVKIDGTDDGSTVIDTYYTETVDNSAAIDIADFRSKTETAKGYYIGRYEAGLDEYDGDLTVCKANKEVWCSIERGEITTTNGITTLTGAISEARGMYDNETGFKSDLVSCYAWDTAIVFIEKCGTKTNSSTYAFQGRLTDDGPLNTATAQDDSDDEKDVQCNIYDMAGNVTEWTTEYSSYLNKKGISIPCVMRGDAYNEGSGATCGRQREIASYDGSTYSNLGFRPILYIL